MANWLPVLLLALIAVLSVPASVTAGMCGSGAKPRGRAKTTDDVSLDWPSYYNTKGYVAQITMKNLKGARASRRVSARAARYVSYFRTKSNPFYDVLCWENSPRGVVTLQWCDARNPYQWWIVCDRAIGQQFPGHTKVQWVKKPDNPANLRKQPSKVRLGNDAYDLTPSKNGKIYGDPKKTGIKKLCVSISSNNKRVEWSAPGWDGCGRNSHWGIRNYCPSDCRGNKACLKQWSMAKKVCGSI